MGNISKDEFCKQYGMCKDKLYRYALYRLGNPDDAEDAVSDAVLSASMPGHLSRETRICGATSPM